MFHENWYSDEQINNLKKIANLTKNLQGVNIEIGCWEGKSTIQLANVFNPEKLICNDTWLGNVEESKVTGIKHLTELILEERDVYSTFINNMDNNTNKNYIVVKEDCLKWLENFNEPIKFIHIDASHEYESVFKTIKLVLPKMVKGGIICGDDFLSANMNRLDLHGGVERAVRETLPGFKNINNLWFYMHE